MNVSMPNDKLVAQEMYTAYMLAYPRPQPTFEPGGYSPETDPWRDHALAAWLLARLVRDREFEKYSLAQFIQNCALFIFGPWEFIERECRSGTSLRRFADHWVTWNTLLAGGEKASHEYTGLKAASRTQKLARGGGEDPRTYALSHWFRDCGASLDPRCDHVPSVRMEREQRREQRRAREAARKKADEYTIDRFQEEIGQIPSTGSNDSSSDDSSSDDATSIQALPSLTRLSGLAHRRRR